MEKEPDKIDRILADVTAEELWRLVDSYRGTDYWYNFMCSLLSLSQTIWMKHKLVPERAKKYFEPEEVAQIIHIYKCMGNDGKASPILFNLDYDGYWTHQVKKAIEKRKWKLAQNILDQASHGLNAYRIPTQASKKCLAELTAYLRSSRRQKKKK